MTKARSFSIISVDEKKCVGCMICEVVCSLTKERKINPDRSRIKVFSLHSHIDLPVVCRQCSDAPCVKACEYEAIYRDKNNAIIINSENCTSCGLCVDACPFGAIFLHPETDIASTCDLCGGKPQCIEWCPTGALSTNSSKRNLRKKAIRYTITKAKPVLTKWGIPESALDEYRKFA